MKKIAVLALVLLMTAAAATACAFTLTGLETETVAREWMDHVFFERMQELTGIAVEANAFYEEKDYKKALDGMKKGDMPADVLFKANLSRTQERELIDAGALVDLAPLIDAHMPNLSALLDAHPDWREVITLEDGRIPSLPQINPVERQACMWINEAWLSALGLSMPGTVGELTAALKAMMAGDPNGNFKNDEVGADLLGVWEMRWLLPYFGIVADDYNMARVDGKAVFAPELPAYRDFVQLLRDWRAEGVLSAKAFTDTHGSALYDTEEKKVAVSGLLLSPVPYTHVPVDAMTQYRPLLMAGPDGSVVWRNMTGCVWTGAFAVTSACKNPGEALAWMDALYAEEAMVLAYAGVEGEDYTFTEEGNWVFEVDAMRTVDDIRGSVLMYTGVTMPGLVPTEFLAKVDSAEDRYIMAACEPVLAAAQQVTLPYALGEEKQARANELAAVLVPMVDKGIARFATGETPLDDEHWNAWLSELAAAGSAELAEIFDSVK